ncbi:MAG: phytanoyl-CoA dioxygenase family protein [Xenococcaceae cyanobacterium MO_207.B15]|nr:phytanoyl-CoA dioxygenase family protein [Xenococcaceae cyanobacterium MO_207.B15]
MTQQLDKDISVDYVEQFKRDGYVVIENALPKEFIEQVSQEFMVAMNDKVRRFNLKRVQSQDGREKGNSNVQLDFRPEGGNHDLNRWNMHLPSNPTFINEQLIANPQVLNTIEHFLGQNPIAFILASDTPYPGSGFQNIHQDFPRFGITVNIPLVDFTEENAPIEVWSGTHIHNSTGKSEFHTGEVDLSKEQLEEIVANVPSKRMLIKAGSILIRDQRMVHRGTGNNSELPRPCLSIWYKNIEEFSLMGLTIPIPHRIVADTFARVALWMRRQGRGNSGKVKNQKLLNFGNFFGRVVEEMSGSDRDYRRVISEEMWRNFSPQMQSLLRYASVEAKLNNTPRSIIGSFILGAIGVIFTINGLLLAVFGKAKK